MHQWTWNVCHFGNLFTVNWHILSIGLFVFHWSLLSCLLVIDFCFLFFWPTWWSCGELEITGVCSRLWGQTSLPQWAAVLPRLHIQGLFFLLLASFSMCVFNNWKSYPYPFAEWSNSTSSKLVPDEESQRYRFYIFSSWVKFSSMAVNSYFENWLKWIFYSLFIHRQKGWTTFEIQSWKIAICQKHWWNFLGKKGISSWPSN